MKYTLLIALLLALFALPGHAELSGPPGSLRPKLTGHLAFAGATEGFRLSGDRATSLAVEGGLRIQNALGLLSLNADARHFFDGELYFKDKSHLALGADVPLGRDACLFITHERRYRTGDDFTLAGIRLTFGDNLAD